MSQATVRIVVPVAAGIVLLLVLGGAPGVANPAPAGHPRPPHFVRLATVEPAGEPAPLPFSGTVRASQRARLAFQISGRLAERPVEVGSRVAAGEVIARLDNPELAPAAEAARARVREIEASLSQNRRDLERVRELDELGAATREEREQLEARSDALRAARRRATAGRERAARRLDEATLVAGFDGEVVAVHAEPGEFLAPGQPVAELLGAGGLEVEIGVPARLAEALSPGQIVALDDPVGGAPAGGGRIVQIASATGPGRLYPVIVALAPSAPLRAGEVVDVLLPRHREELLAVPVRAVVDTGLGQPRVYRHRDGRVEVVTVALRGISGGRALVEGGLAAGDELVLDGLVGLVGGQAVRTVR